VGDEARRRQFLEQTSALFGPVAAGDLYLSRVGVLRAFQGRGFGKALVQEIVRTGERVAAANIVLDVSSTSLRAIELYRRSGFQPLEERHAEELGLAYVRMSKRLR
jgi:ribosomal protein S18 acetylase RimI-like enzyme